MTYLEQTPADRFSEDANRLWNGAHHNGFGGNHPKHPSDLSLGSRQARRKAPGTGNDYWQCVRRR